jgi:hypothetical protein
MSWFANPVSTRRKRENMVRTESAIGTFKASEEQQINKNGIAQYRVVKTIRSFHHLDGSTQALISSQHWYHAPIVKVPALRQTVWKKTSLTLTLLACQKSLPKLVPDEIARFFFLLFFSRSRKKRGLYVLLPAISFFFVGWFGFCAEVDRDVVARAHRVRSQSRWTNHRSKANLASLVRYNPH